MSIVLTGGGTGGHLAIVESIKEQLKGEQLVYVGSSRGQDKKWFQGDESFVDSYFLDTKGVANQGIFGKLASIGWLMRSIWRAFKILGKHNTKVVFCVGGFSAAPASIAAILRGIPLVIHEQNAHIGLLNRLLKPFAARFLSSYHSPTEAIAYPVKEIYFKQARVRKEIHAVIFLGGSGGAKAINELALELAPYLNSKGISIIHQAGDKNTQEVQEAYRSLGIEAEVFGFTKELPRYIAMADLAIARGGASTLWELCASGLPAVFIPYPYAAGDHQYHNAKYLADKNLAWVIRQDEVTPQALKEIIANPSLEEKSQQLIDTIEPNGSVAIARILQEYSQ